MPCNFHLRALAAKVKDGIRAAGGTPMELNTIAISDGITMGTMGMRASLPSRELIADSIELVCDAHLFDAVIAIAGCDKTIPGDGDGAVPPERARADALRRLDPPRQLPRRSGDDPGGVRGGRRTRGRPDLRAGAVGARGGRLSGAGACGGQFTANTMAMAFEALGISPPGALGCPGGRPVQAGPRRPGRPDGAGRARPGQRPSDIITRESLENAIAAIACSGGSTNGVLHLLAIAKEIGVELSIDDFDRISDADAAAVRPQAGRTVRRLGPVRGGRRPGRAQAAEGGRAAARRGADGDGQDDRRARGGRGGDRGPASGAAAR